MEIRSTQLDDLSSLATFLSEHGTPCDPEMLRWKFWASPGRLRGEHKSFIAVIDDAIVGHIGVIPTRLCLSAEAGGQMDGGWFVDWLVREDLRSRGIGVFLLRQAAQTCRCLMTIQGSADTRAALPQLDWSQHPCLAVHKLNVRAGGTSANAGLGQRITAELARALRYHPVRHAAPAGWRLDESNDEAWDLIDAALTHGAHHANGQLYHCWRSGAFLRWSFRDHPAWTYELSIASEHGHPAGCAIWRTLVSPNGRRDARIVDVSLPWDRPDAWSWLISALTARLAEEGIVQISCLAGTGSPLAEALSANRYLARQKLPLWLSPEAPGLGAGRSWHLTFADSDIDIAAQD